MKNQEQTTNLLQNEKKMTIIFDIDDTLADHYHTKNQDRLYIHRKSMLLIASEVEHRVFPGVIELMRFLLSKDYIKVAFFSSGSKERNVEFVKKLLIRAIGENKYRDVESSIVILSQEDLTERNKNQDIQMSKNFGLSSGGYKKDITKALSRGATLKNTIFIDDVETYVFYGQERSFLLSPSNGHRDYYILKGITPDIEYYEEEVEDYFFSFNTVFYIAGVLSDCIDKFEQGGDLNSLLFDMHFKKSTHELFGFERCYDSKKNKEYYIKGLNCLRNVNPALCFVSHEDYVDILSAPVTDEEQQIIDNGQLRTAKYSVM